MRNFGLFFLVLVFVALPSFGLAKLGVGVNTGKITIDEPLKAGGVYELPPLVVINTGDEASSYGASIEYHVNQPEHRPERSWFRFTPEIFHLEPGGTQKVAVQLTLPVNAPPGDYFAYVEGHPIYIDTGSGVARIGIAAAAKLYFTVAPANVFQGIYYRFLYFWNAWTPWVWIALAILVGAVLLLLARRFFAFNIGFRKKADPPQFSEVDLGGDEEVIIIRRSKKPRKLARTPKKQALQKKKNGKQ